MAQFTNFCLCCKNFCVRVKFKKAAVCRQICLTPLTAVRTKNKSCYPSDPLCLETTSTPNEVTGDCFVFAPKKQGILTVTKHSPPSRTLCIHKKGGVKHRDFPLSPARHWVGQVRGKVSRPVAPNTDTKWQQVCSNFVQVVEAKIYSLYVNGPALHIHRWFLQESIERWWGGSDN